MARTFGAARAAVNTVVVRARTQASEVRTALRSRRGFPAPCPIGHGRRAGRVLVSCGMRAALVLRVKSFAVVDPGHGGDAPLGASSHLGLAFHETCEKDVNLELAQRIACRLGGRVLLTRDTDRNVSLADRAGLARSSGAAAFVSVHSGGARAGEMEIFVHEHASDDDLRLANELAESVSRSSRTRPRVRRGEMALLHPQMFGGRTACCLIEVDAPLHHEVGEQLRLDGLAHGIAAGVGRFLAPAANGAANGAAYGAAYGKSVSLVTKGEYSLELNKVWVNLLGESEADMVIDVLKQSSEYVDAVKHVDKETIGMWTDRGLDVGIDNVKNGRVTSGKEVGKFVLDFYALVGDGAQFRPGGGISDDDYNMITVEAPADTSAKERGRWVEEMIHETFHYENFVFNTFPPASSSLSDRADAFFDQEISVRKRTAKAMKEILSGAPKALKGFKASAPNLKRRDVERDFFPGSDTLTYLEHFVFNDLISDELVAAAPTPSQLSDMKALSKTGSVGPSDDLLLGQIGGFVFVLDPVIDLFVEPTSNAVRLMVQKRAVSKRWSNLIDAGLTDAIKETALQEHAKRAFPSGIGYTP